MHPTAPSSSCAAPVVIDRITWSPCAGQRGRLPRYAHLNKKNRKDTDRCPAIIRDAGGRVVHIPFTLDAIKHALDNFPSSFATQSANDKATASWYYEKFD